MNAAPSIDQVVKQASDSWIVCRSKSHAGRVYYFNTLTGEAAWNLSAAEIEKAKSFTKSISKQGSLSLIEGCPEPKEPPMELTQDASCSRDNQTHSASSRVYNKQIINNQFTKSAYPLTPFIIPPFNQVIQNPINTIVPFALTDAKLNYNTNVWTVPPTLSSPQLFLAGSVAFAQVPVQSQIQNNLPGSVTLMDYGTNIPKQSTSTSTSNRLTNFKNRSTFCHPQKKFYKLHEKHYEMRWKRDRPSDKKVLGKGDLRNKLQRRPSHTDNENEELNASARPHASDCQSDYAAKSDSYKTYNEDFKAYKNNTDIPISTNKEIKQFLSQPSPETKVERLKPPPCFKKPSLKSSVVPLRINFENDRIATNNQENESEEVTCQAITEDSTENVRPESEDTCQEKSSSKVIIEGDTENASKSKDTSQEESPKVKCTADASVQTDLQEEIIWGRHYLPKELPKGDNSTDAEQSQENSQENKTSSKQTGKKDIKLNRTAKATINGDGPKVEKKIYKWRKRRHPTATMKCSSQESSCSTFDENISDTSSIQHIATSNTLQVSYHDESESDASFIISRNMTTDSRIVEETSTSGIISNTNSIIDSESEKGNKTCAMFDFRQAGPINRIVFEVSGSKMEDSLRLMAEEWVSRFKQIMENVLMSILRNDGGGPWNILEATNLIKIKYGATNRDVNKACTLLMEILSKKSDNNGRITTNLLPSEYMEMYSHGVYLIVSLKKIITSCEDLHNADDDLSKLLSDIKNAMVDTSYNDTSFVYSFPQETSETSSHIKSPQTNETPANEVTPVKQIIKSNASSRDKWTEERSYNLRSKTPALVSPKKDNKGNENDVATKDKTGQEFFSSLKLMKSSPFKNIIITKPNTRTQAKPHATGRDSQDSPIKSIFDRHTAGPENNTGTSNTKVTVIRNLTISPQIIKKFRNCKPSEPKELLDMDRLDYSENIMDGEHCTDEYSQEKDTSEEFRESHERHEYEYLHDDVNYDEGVDSEGTPEIEIDNTTRFCIDSDTFVHDSPLSINKNLKFVFHTIIQKVKETLVEQKNFCLETSKELGKCGVRSKRDCEIKRQSERAQLILDNICITMNAILLRETGKPERNIQSLLKNAGIHDFEMDDIHINDYRNVISRCLKQAQILQESLRHILTIIDKKHVR